MRTTPAIAYFLVVQFFWRQIVLVAILLLFLSSTATAVLVDEHSWTFESEDGRYVLVQLQLDPESVDSADLEGVELKKNYRKSGLYMNDGSKEPLWEMPYHPPVYNIYFSPDGNHVVLAAEWPEQSISNIGLGAQISFYHKSNEKQFWQEHEISWGWVIKRLASRFLGFPELLWEEVIYNPVTLTYTVKTNQAEEISFDIRTGQIIRTRSLWNTCIGIFLVAIPMVVYISFRCRSPSKKTLREPKHHAWQISLRELLLLITAASLLLGLMTFSKYLALGIACIAIFGGSIARFISGKRRAWLTGSLLSIYGTGLGLLAFATLGEPILWRLSDYHYLREFLALALLAICPISGCIAGSMLAGRMEKRWSMPSET